ncbi:RDD family protein [Streptomyces gamaensis]|uniref:RDD family protein n=1 Tax=Streptomyces gamaensis TaxID=1763542 RepID=A0ABW0Z4B3_9ACTN
MSAPTSGSADNSPVAGFYPDPSIPGYIRYWSGSAWVPGTSRPAPADGEPMPTPPAGLAPAAPSLAAPVPPTPRAASPAARPVEETGPVFLDEEPAGPDAGAVAGGRGGTVQLRTQRGRQPGRPAAGAGGGAGDWAGPSGPQTARGAEAVPPGGPGEQPGAYGPSPAGPDGRFGAAPGAGEDPGPAEESGAETGRQDAYGAVRQPAAARSVQPSPQPSVQPEYPGPREAVDVPAAVRPGQDGHVPAPAARAAHAAEPAAQGAQFREASAERSAEPSAEQAAGWAQQVHQLAQRQPQGGLPQPYQPAPPPAVPQTAGSEAAVPWKPPVQDPFLLSATETGKPAALGRRLAARVVDSLVTGAVVAAAAVPLWSKAVDHIDAKIEQAKQSGQTVTVWLVDGTTGPYLGVVLGVLLLFGVLYEALPTAKWGRTAGKKLCGLRVLGIESHEAPSFGAALRRWLLYGVLGVLAVGVLNVLWCLFDRPWRQCWHDKAARTFVAEAKAR